MSLIYHFTELVNKTLELGRHEYNKFTNHGHISSSIKFNKIYNNKYVNFKELVNLDKFTTFTTQTVIFSD